MSKRIAHFPTIASILSLVLFAIQPTQTKKNTMCGVIFIENIEVKNVNLSSCIFVISEN